MLVPLGAASKEHGPHLKLRNDVMLADYLTGRVSDSTTVVVAPTSDVSLLPCLSRISRLDFAARWPPRAT